MGGPAQNEVMAFVYPRGHTLAHPPRPSLCPPPSLPLSPPSLPSPSGPFPASSCACAARRAIYMVATAGARDWQGSGGEQRTPVAMGLRYATQFGDGSPFVSGDAYERMLLNACRGDQALSVSAAELVEAWRIFTPLLHQIDEQKPQPVVHAFGDPWPEGFPEWAKKQGVDVVPLQASWGAKEAEEKLEAQLAAHRAAVAAQRRLLTLRRADDMLLDTEAHKCAR